MAQRKINFARGKFPGSLTDIPGIGPVKLSKLNHLRIVTPRQFYDWALVANDSEVISLGLFTSVSVMREWHNHHEKMIEHGVITLPVE